MTKSNKSGGKRKRKCMIATDTAEKLEIEERQSTKANTNRLKEGVKNKKS